MGGIILMLLYNIYSNYQNIVKFDFQRIKMPSF